MSKPGHLFVDANCIVAIVSEEKYTDICRSLLHGKFKFFTSHEVLGEVLETIRDKIDVERQETAYHELCHEILPKISVLRDPHNKDLYRKLYNEFGLSETWANISSSDVRHLSCAIHHKCDLFTTLEKPLNAVKDSVSEISYKHHGERTVIKHPKDLNI